MKVIDENFIGRRGSIPPQLFKYIDMNNMAEETRKFTEYMNAAAAGFLTEMVGVNYYDSCADYSVFTPKMPKLFGCDVTVEYIASGSVGAVYKMRIGDSSFAFKINLIEGFIGDICAISEHKRARNLINRPYIGSIFMWCGCSYSWILSDYVADDYTNSFVDAKAKYFYAAMTKGLYYDDMIPANTKNGRIIDLDGIKHSVPKLTRVEIDMVKKFMHLMRVGNMDAVRALADVAVIKHPNVIKHIFSNMKHYQMAMPLCLQKYKKMIAEYRANIIARGNIRQR